MGRNLSTLFLAQSNVDSMNSAPWSVVSQDPGERASVSATCAAGGGREARAGANPRSQALTQAISSSSGSP